MADKRLLEFIIRFKNDASAALAGVKQSLTGVADETDKLTKEQRKANAEAKALNGQIISLTKQFLALGAATGLAIGVRTGIDTLAKYSQQMSTVKAITEATETEFKSLDKVARGLGATTRFTAIQAAEGMELLGQSGFTANEILASTKDVLTLAQAGGLDLARAADIASSALRGFNLDVEDAGHVMDVLALAAIKTNSNVNELGEGLKLSLIHI